MTFWINIFTVHLYHFLLYFNYKLTTQKMFQVFLRLFGVLFFWTPSKTASIGALRIFFQCCLFHCLQRYKFSRTIFWKHMHINIFCSYYMSLLLNSNFVKSRSPRKIVLTTLNRSVLSFRVTYLESKCFFLDRNWIKKSAESKLLNLVSLRYTVSLCTIFTDKHTI